MADLIIKTIDKEKKNKEMFVLKCKGKDLIKTVREMTDKLSEEFDNINK